jgi:two-component system phosphate regulon sensor histidine kinase PhoR
LRHSAIILLAAGLALCALVVLADLSLARAVAVFICIAAAALVPWRLHHVAASRDDVRAVTPVESAAVSAVVAGMPDPAVLLDRAGRVIHLNAAAAQLAPALRKNELAQFALRSPEIITALRESDRDHRAAPDDLSRPGPGRSLDGTDHHAGAGADAVRRHRQVHADDRSTTRRRCAGSRKCAPISSPMPATNCARRSRRCRASSIRCRGRPRTTPRRASAFLGIMHTQATRMARLIDDLLSLSRVELSAHVRPDASVDIVPSSARSPTGWSRLRAERLVAIGSIARHPGRDAGDRGNCCGCSQKPDPRMR